MKELQKSEKFGFTLIELLVVVSLISLIATLAVTVINFTRVRARNATRNADIVQLEKALQLVADNTGGQFPLCQGPQLACVSAECSGEGIGYINDPGIDAAIKPYISKPSDPADSKRPIRGYFYYGPQFNQDFGYGPLLFWFLEYGGDCGRGSVFATLPNVYTMCVIYLE